MKKKFSLVLFLMMGVSITAQKLFHPKNPDVDKLKKILLNSNYTVNNNLIYFDSNYIAITEKINIKLDPDFDNTECGFTKKYKPGIIYIYENCGEAKPLQETIIFPKTTNKILAPWIELLYQSNATEIKNIWYDNNKYGPHDKEAGCYYTIKQGKDTTSIDIWCGS